MSNDPLAFNAGDTNLYRYAQSRPIDMSDRLGLKIEFTGDAASVKKAKDLLDTIKENGTKEAKDMIKKMEDDPATVTIKVVENTPNIVGGSGKPIIDIGDIGKYPKGGEIISQESVLMHELVEQFEIQKNGTAPLDAHKAGMASEKLVTGADRSFGGDHFVRNADGTITAVTDYVKGGKKYPVKTTINTQNGNVVSVNVPMTTSEKIGFLIKLWELLP